MNRIRSSHRSLLASLALCLIVVPATLIVPAQPAAAQTAQDHKAALDALKAQMAQLRQTIAAFRILPDYCPPNGAKLAAHRQQIADWDRQVADLNGQSLAAQRKLEQALREALVRDGRDGEITDTRTYAQDRSQLSSALNQKKNELGKAIDATKKKCGGSGTSTSTAVSTGQGPVTTPPPTNTSTPQPPAGPTTPEITPPTYQAVSPLDLPSRYCSVKERVDLQLSLEAEQIKAHENTRLAGMFRTDVMWAIFHLEQDKRPVPPLLRALEARAIAERAQWQGMFDAIQQLRSQAGRIPLIDCLAAIEKLRTGQASNSGTEVQPGFPTQRDASQDVRRDVEDRMRDAERQEGRSGDRTETVPQNELPPVQPSRPGYLDVDPPLEEAGPPPPPSRPGYLEIDPPAQGIAGFWRLANASSGVSTVTIGSNLILTGMGPAIQLQRDGNAYYGEGAVLFGKGGHSIRLIDRGNGVIDVFAQNSAGGSFSTTMSRG